MSEMFKCNYCEGPCNIPGDLQAQYRLAKSQLGLLPPKGDQEDEWEGTRYNCEETIEFIERIARAEAKVAALEAKAECAAHEFCLDSDHALARRNSVKARIAALEAENGRLKAPVSEAECETLNKATYYAMGDTLDRLIPTFNALIAARAKQPSPAQDRPKRERLNKGQCAAQVVDCDCVRCSPAQDKEQG